MQRLPRLVTPLLILALCALVVWWVTRLMQGATIPIPPTATTDGDGGASRTEAVLASARLFGSRRPGVLSDNVRALGVVADATGRGSVIVSVDGQAARIYRVGDTLDGRLVSAIRPEEIELEAGGARQVFRLPPARGAAPGITVLGSNAVPIVAGSPQPQSQPPVQAPGLPPSAGQPPGQPVAVEGMPYGSPTFQPRSPRPAGPGPSPLNSPSLNQ